MSLCKTADGITCYANVQKIPNKLYLANVQQPIEFLKSLDSDQPEIVINSAGDISSALVPEKGKFIFVTFSDPAATSTESRAELLARHDAIISKLTATLSETHKNVLIIYTGQSPKINARRIREAAETHSSNDTDHPAPAPAAALVPETDSTTAGKVEVKEPKATQRFVALLTKEEGGDGIFYNLDHMLLYFKNITIVNGADEVLFDVHRPVITKHENHLAVDISDGAAANHLAFNVNNASGRWWIDTVTWKGKAVRSKTVIAANEGFGFRCTPVIEFKDGKTVVLLWRRLQIQPNFVDSKMLKFGDTFDCVGFTSPGIWGGLFVTFLMIFILSIGMCWMMDIRTMDRFDDPKGKTIIVNVSE